MKHKQYYFPNNYRFIAERQFIVMAFSVVLSVEILFSITLVYQGYKQKEQVRQQRMAVLHEIGKWERIVTTYPDYRDGYIHLGLLTYTLADDTKAMQYVDKALDIDPNNSTAQELKKQIAESNR